MDTRTFYLACLERCQIILSTSILSCACRVLTLLTIYLISLPRFYRVGGTTRLSGFMLAGATFAVLLAGTGPIAYIRESSIVSHRYLEPAHNYVGHSGHGCRCTPLCAGN